VTIPLILTFDFVVATIAVPFPGGSIFLFSEQTADDPGFAYAAAGAGLELRDMAKTFSSTGF